MRIALILVLCLSLLSPAHGAPRRAPPGEQVVAYGGDPAQTLDFWPGQTDSKPNIARPLVIFVHGGGWKRGSKDNATGRHKSVHYQQLGYAFASIDYRLVPGATVEQQAQDVADAVAFLRRRAATLGVDPGRIVLMGHSAGAHLVALVGTDMRYFAKAGLSPDAVRGIIPLDGAAYDVAAQMAQSGRLMKGTYEQAFGTDPARQQALSPTRHAARPNAPAFLILHVDRDDGTAQSQALAAALKRAGTPVEIRALEGRGLRGHMQINRQMGDPAYPGTAVVDDWLARVVR
ncbi:MAG: alpha/beta hydrolase [Pseudomonadota bacterium]|uniref:Alpha/beta hydrolase n=1 Tax=Sphingobium xenophagum TaxID=121428 RepID=A0A249MSA2_SPHXE|nr:MULTISPECIES: alpha/beta hydrolase [Sphingobium]ASY44240.1 alpha/beta hydrolase [Sphingobium xenophagum]OUC56323.1 alpha/beta hydrolase [Sphingobium sp. GW456-12-10-14-TSB1]QWT15455.1 alpha/beta fold hydrolase [Sphingobium xenophagum]